jgi:hypothetical protein
MLDRRGVFWLLATLASAASCDEVAVPSPTSTERCSGDLTAWLLAPPESPAGARLTEAGFVVHALPLDRSPSDLEGAIVFASGVAETEAYAAYLERYADDLVEFVESGNVLVQLPQSAADEPVPGFVPQAHAAKRARAAGEAMQVLASDHPLLSGLSVVGGRLAWPGAVAQDAFAEPHGFEVLLAEHGDGRAAGLLEAAHGRGRIVLSTLAFDAAAAESPEQLAFAQRFFANLARHTSEVCAGTAPSPQPTISGASHEFEPGSSVLIGLPDTQVYSERYPDIFDAQTGWIRSHAGELDIRYVFHFGDIVNFNSSTEWARARRAMAELDGVVPYALAVGNHDYGPSGKAATRETGLGEWFPYPEDDAAEGLAGAFEPGKLDNTYHLFEAGGHGFIALALEWGPRDEVVAWANHVMSMHPDRLGILVTHAYLDADDHRQDHRDPARNQEHNPHHYPTPGGVNDGEELWQKLVRKHRFVMTLSGHVLGDGVGYLVSTNDLGGEVHQMLANYQMRVDGGEGYMRILEIMPNGHTVRVRTYSPVLDVWLADADHRFEIELDVGEPGRRQGRSSAPAVDTP